MNGSAEGSTPKRARCPRTRSDGLGGVLTALAPRKSKLMAINGHSGHSSPPPRSRLGSGTSFSPQSGVKDGSANHLKAGSFMGCDPWGPPFERRATEQLAQAVAADLAPIQRRLAPWGDHPKTRSVRDGQGVRMERWVQRLHREDGERLAQQVNGLWGKVRRAFASVPVYARHPDLGTISPETGAARQEDVPAIGKASCRVWRSFTLPNRHPPVDDCDTIAIDR